MLKRYLIIVLLFVFIAPMFGQGQKVIISEIKKGKRIDLFAENKTSDSLNIFLLVNAEGYRRSASKPILKDIAPNSKVYMTTLIELAGQKAFYTYDLVVNEFQKDINIHFTDDTKDISKVVNGRIVIFSAPGCQKCEVLASKLEEQRIKHKVFNIKRDRTTYQQFMSFIERSLTEETRIRFPVVWNKDYTIFGYEDLEVILTELRK